MKRFNLNVLFYLYQSKFEYQNKTETIYQCTTNVYSHVFHFINKLKSHIYLHIPTMYLYIILLRRLITIHWFCLN